MDSRVASTVFGSNSSLPEGGGRTGNKSLLAWSKWLHYDRSGQMTSTSV